MKDALFVLDSYGLIYRSYFAFGARPLVNSSGENVSAAFGFFRSLHSLLKSESPKLFAAAFDSAAPTFRQEIYPEYKATRPKTPEDLHAQIPLIEEILKALGIASARQEGFEADDVIASLAARCEAEGRPCVILSADKDLVQLAGGLVSIMEPSKAGGWDEVTEASVLKKWGVKPSQMLDFLSLTGDRSDNVPGVAGIGAVTAAKLLNEHGTLEGIYAAVDTVKGAAGKRLREGKESAFFSRRLITLSREVPLPDDLTAFSCESLETVAAAEILLRHGMPKIAESFAGKEAVAALKKSGVQAEKPKSAPSGGEGDFREPPFSHLVFSQDELKQNSGRYSAIYSMEELKALIDRALQKGVAAFDTETTGLNTLTDRIVGFSLSVEAGEGFYVPLEAQEAGYALISKDDAIGQLERLFIKEDFLLIVHNGKFDLEVMKTARAAPLRCALFDTMIAAWIIDPDYPSFSLEYLAETLLGLKGIEFADIVPKGKTFDYVSLEQAQKYAAEDADFTLRLYEFLSPKIDEWNARDVFSKIEMPLVPVLAEMESEGIAVDKERLLSFAEKLGAQIDSCERQIFAIAGREFNISSPKQLQEVLFEERGLPPGKKTKSGYSTDNTVLESLILDDPLPALILDYRAMTKLKSSYADALPSMADSAGRIHTSFIQTGTATGRLSSRDPNLQNIPVREENGRQIRRAFNAPAGKTLVSADYSQIELTLLAHFSEDESLVQAFLSGVDVHTRTAALIFGCPPESVTPEMRRVAKTINFGVMYGMSSFRLANQMRIPKSEAASFINAYFATYSGVASFIQEAKEKAARQGWVETLMGRRRYIRGIKSANRNERAAAERVAVNTPIQGSAADIVKTAMLKMKAALEQKGLSGKMLLQVHDELIFEAPQEEAEETGALAKEVMEGVAALKVPLRVSVETGPCWGDFH